MPWWTLVALGAFGAVFVVTAVLGTVLAVRTLRAVRGAQELLLGATTPVIEGLDILQARVGALSARRSHLDSSVGSLQRARRQLDVLVWALADVRGFVSRARGAVPRK